MSNGLANNLSSPDVAGYAKAGLALERSEGLSRQKIRQLLAAIGSGPAEDTQIEFSEHDWLEPHYFSTGELNRLDNFMETVATAIAKTFAQIYHSGFNVTTTSIREHFAGVLFDQILSSGQNDYYLAFGPNQGGLIIIPQQTAVTWTKQLLGDVEPEKDSRDSASRPGQGGLSRSTSGLSQLEESLLFDIVSAVIKSISTSMCPPLADNDFQPVSGLVKGHKWHGLQARGNSARLAEPQKTSSLQSIQEICKIVFNIEKNALTEDKPASACEAYLLMPCSMLAPVVGKKTETDKKLSSEDISKAILEHLQQMPVSVTARLAWTTFTFEQMMNLCSGDILLFDKSINDPIELVVEGRTAFCGQPAKSAGQYAIVITEVPCNTK